MTTGTDGDSSQGGLSPDEAERLASEIKPSWELDEEYGAAPTAAAAAPTAGAAPEAGAPVSAADTVIEGVLTVEVAGAPLSARSAAAAAEPPPEHPRPRLAPAAGAAPPKRTMVGMGSDEAEAAMEAARLRAAPARQVPSGGATAVEAAGAHPASVGAPATQASSGMATPVAIAGSTRAEAPRPDAISSDAPGAGVTRGDLAPAVTRGDPAPPVTRGDPAPPVTRGDPVPPVRAVATRVGLADPVAEPPSGGHQDDARPSGASRGRATPAPVFDERSESIELPITTAPTGQIVKIGAAVVGLIVVALGVRALTSGDDVPAKPAAPIVTAAPTPRPDPPVVAPPAATSTTTVTAAPAPTTAPPAATTAGVTPPVATATPTPTPAPAKPPPPASTAAKKPPPPPPAPAPAGGGTKKPSGGGIIRETPF